MDIIFRYSMKVTRICPALDYYSEGETFSEHVLIPRAFRQCTVKHKSPTLMASGDLGEVGVSQEGHSAVLRPWSDPISA